jgi:hypothetical protein
MDDKTLTQLDVMTFKLLQAIYAGNQVGSLEGARILRVIVLRLRLKEIREGNGSPLVTLKMANETTLQSVEVSDILEELSALHDALGKDINLDD